MKSRPILFNGSMVRSLLDDIKKQTRRVVKPQPPADAFQVTTYHHPDSRPRFFSWKEGFDGAEMHTAFEPIPCPYGMPGDRLWVRETHIAFDVGRVHYRADSISDRKGDREYGVTWPPSIHMPRWASRITLEITGARVERLQDISEEDARAEGVDFDPGEGGFFFVPGQGGCSADTAVGSYRLLWESINGSGSWDANPWVWAIQFKRVLA